MHRRSLQTWAAALLLAALVLPLGLVAAPQTAQAAQPAQAAPLPVLPPLKPIFRDAVAFDVSRPLRDLAGPVTALQSAQAAQAAPAPDQEPIEIRPERRPAAVDTGYAPDGALQSGAPQRAAQTAAAQPAAPQAAAIPAPSANFEGLSNQDNFNIYGGRVNPPDPVGDVGPNHYVEMINLAFAVYNKQGTLLLGPAAIGTLWSGFAIADCAGASGDPIVLYDQLEDRWLLSQFTSAGPEYWNCVAISQTGDPTGAYYRYAFSAGPFFPDYPKYGVWTNSYLLTSRDFGPTIEYGISVYALEKNKMLAGNPKARAVQFFLDATYEGAGVPLNLVGDGLLPADIDGTRRPIDRVPAPIVGTQDDNAGYGATFDAVNIFDLSVQWQANPVASLTLAAQLPVAAFDSVFPCAPTSRDCLPQPGITDPAQYLDILSYRQRPTWRLAYRNMGKYEALVTNQSVEARPATAGVRWYELRRTNGAYSVNQQGTFAPEDGVNRWMGSIAMDWQGNMGLGYSVVNGVDVYPGIRYTGRLAADPAGQMTLGEGTIIAGTGVQRTTNSRWGDYTSMNIDPVDDCTFWYVNEYYTAAGQASSLAGWQTRIGSFKLPGCAPRK
jgi:hypothetical protein